MSVVSQSQPVQLSPLFAGLFPLPLTPFEWFMLLDTRPGYSMLCDMELRFQGSLDPAAFEAALAFALARNPLFTCLVAESKSGPPVWVPSEQRPVVDWAPLGTPLDKSYGLPIDLHEQIGLRVYVRQGEERSTVLLHFHHSCADGIGSFGFIEDLLAGYTASLPGSEAATPRTIEPERLAAHGALGLDGRGFWRKLADAFGGVREGAKYLGQWPRPLAATRAGAAAENRISGPDFVVADCSESTAAGLRQVATAAGATVNDVLLRDLFVTMRRWNEELGSPLGRRRMRILMPQNLRSKEDRSMPAANAMSFAFMTRAGRWCDQPAALLESIREETEAVRRGQLSLYFTGVLASLQSAGVLSWLLKQHFCFASAVLTNLSDPLRRFTTRFPKTEEGLIVGNVVFQGIRAVPPLRPLTRAAFCIINGAKDFSISFKWDRQYLSPLDAERLLGQYVAQLNATAAGAAGGPPDI